VITPEHDGDNLFLEGAQLSPTKTVDDVVLKGRMEQIERSHGADASV
jgi:hypothetical protein